MAQDHLKKQNVMLMRLIEDFNDKYSGIKEQFQVLKSEGAEESEAEKSSLLMSEEIESSQGAKEERLT